MASEPIRDSAKDHLLTPKNSALINIDYQPVQVNSIASMDRRSRLTTLLASPTLGGFTSRVKCSYEVSNFRVGGSAKRLFSF